MSPLQRSDHSQIGGAVAERPGTHAPVGATIPAKPSPFSDAPSSDPDLSTFLAPLIRHIEMNPEREVQSVVAFCLPFCDPVNAALVVLSDTASDPMPLLLAAGSEILAKVDVMCLRKSELYQLAFPNSHDPGSFAMPYWIRNQGQVLWGLDLRSAVPTLRHPLRLLANHLDATYFSRNLLVLNHLHTERYAVMEARVRHERTLLMSTALLERGIWRVYPDSVAAQFCEVYDDAFLRDNIAEAEVLARHIRTAAAGEGKAMAYRYVWLFEQFLEGLLKYST
jgi:hypothetical protein